MIVGNGAALFWHAHHSSSIPPPCKKGRTLPGLIYIQCNQDPVPPRPFSMCLLKLHFRLHFIQISPSPSSSLFHYNLAGRRERGRTPSRLIQITHKENKEEHSSHCFPPRFHPPDFFSFFSHFPSLTFMADKHKPANGLRAVA